MSKSSTKKTMKQDDPALDNGNLCLEETAGAEPGLADVFKELRAFRSETSYNFGALKVEINELTKDLGEIKKRVDVAEQRLSDNEDKETNLTRVVIHLLQEQKQLREKCEDMESRSRRNNIRIYSVPEKSEGNYMIEFVSNLIREKFDMNDELHIERAHRVPVPRTSVPKAPGQSEFPRSIIVEFRSHIIKQNILKAAWTKKNVQVGNTRIYFDEDFTPAVFKERGKYKDVRKVLQQRKIKYNILFPARLKIYSEEGKTKVFDNPAAAAQGLREFGINMELSVEEDLEATLCAAGWQTASPRKKRGSDSELMEAVKFLLENKHQDEITS